MKLVVAEVRVGDGAGVVVTGEDGAGDGGHQPAVILETGLGNGFAFGFHERIALDAPGATGEVQAPIGPGRGRGMGLRLRTAATVNLELGEDVMATLGRAGHEHAHIPARGRLSKLDIVGGGERLKGPPGGGIVRDLEGAFRGAFDPIQLDAVEDAGSAEIDIDPLLAIGSAHPGAGKVIRATGLDTVASIEPSQLADAPSDRAGGIKVDAVEAVAGGRGQGDGGLEVAGRMVGAGGAAQFLPGLPVVGAGEDAGPAFRLVGVRIDARLDVQTVNRGRAVSASPFELHPGGGAGEGDAGHRVAVQQVVALVLGEDACLAGGDGYPAGRFFGFDSVGDQLGGQVVVVAAGVVGGAAEGQVAIRGGLDHHGR